MSNGMPTWAKAATEGALEFVEERFKSVEKRLDESERRAEQAAARAQKVSQSMTNAVRLLGKIQQDIASATTQAEEDTKSLRDQLSKVGDESVGAATSTGNEIKKVLERHAKIIDRHSAMLGQQRIEAVSLRKLLSQTGKAIQEFAGTSGS